MSAFKRECRQAWQNCLRVPSASPLRGGAHHRNRMTRCERYDLLDTVVKENIIAHEQRPGLCLDKARKGCVDFAVGAGLQYLNLNSNSRDRRQHVSCCEVVNRIGEILKKADGWNLRHQLVQQRQCFVEPMPKASQTNCIGLWRPNAEITDHRHCRLLRARRLDAQQQERSRDGRSPFLMSTWKSSGLSCMRRHRYSGPVVEEDRQPKGDGHGFPAPTQAIDLESISDTSGRWCLVLMTSGRFRTCGAPVPSKRCAEMRGRRSSRPRWQTPSRHRADCTEPTFQSTSPRCAMSTRLVRAAD
jgi:hypothetical protein